MTRKQLFLTIAAILGSSIVMLGESVANLALPSISHTFNAPFAALQWVVDGYTLALSALILVGGSLGDSFGLRRVYLWSLATFFCISLLCTLAWDVWSLVFLRTLLGVAGAFLTPVSLALLNAQLPEALRSRAIGAWTAWTTAVITLGPLIGGYLIDVASWRAIFLINLPFALIAFFLGYFYLRDQQKKETHLDWQGVIFGFVGLGGVTFSLIEGPQLGWNALTISALVGGITLLLLFIRWEGRIKYPQVDLSLFRSKIFSATNAATFLLYGAFSGFGLVFAVFLQTVGQYSSAMTGAAFIPSSILLILFSSKIGGLSKKWGARWFMTVGPIVCGLGMLFLLPLGPHPSYISNLLPGIMLFGIGLTIVVAPLTATALNSAPESKSGLASAINNGVASVGPLIAVALIGIFGADHAYSFTTILCATLAILSGLISFAYVRP